MKIKRYLLIDSRIRKTECEYLQKYFSVIKLPLSEDVYDEISGHTDIFYCNINNKLFVAPNAPIKADELRKILKQEQEEALARENTEKKYIEGKLECNQNLIAQIKNTEIVECKLKVENKYPKDIFYNVCQIGDNIIGSKYAIDKVKPTVTAKQGYAKCSIMVTGINSCITTDEGIYTKLSEKNVDTTYIKENNINLIDRSGKKTEKKGFIGGASFTFKNKVVIFGDIDKLESKKEIIEHLKKYKLELVDFKGLDVIDYGGAIII